VPDLELLWAAVTAAISFRIESLASPNSIEVSGS